MNIEIINELKEYVKKGREILADAEAEYCSPYYGYFTDVRKDSKYDELRQKIKNAMLEESVSYFNY